ncbi:MAG: hypothetical protein Q4C56_03500 [Peptococcaceae bacterium]|nr:hypothetical protein [Peptococcaceae bacterium]
MKKMQVGEVLRIRTWKNDRGLAITCVGADVFRLAEDGFASGVQEGLSRAQVLKAIKPIARREFPRSNKLRLTLSKEDANNG